MTAMMKFSLAVIGLGLFAGCFRKKSDPLSLESWMDKNFPGEFTIVDSRVSDLIGNLSFKVKKSVVAEVADPMVQMIVEWDKRAPDLGLSPEDVRKAHENARKYLEAAKTLRSALSEVGLQSFATGCYRGVAHVLLFAEPNAEQRQHDFILVAKGIEKWQNPNNYSIHVAFSDEQAAEYKDIYLAAYWAQNSAALLPHFTWEIKGETAILKDGDAANAWELNTASNLFGIHTGAAREQMMKWAETNMKKSVILLSTIEVEQDKKQHTRFNMRFPYVFGEANQESESSEEEIAGYLVGDYDVEASKLEHIHKEAE